MVIEAVKIWNEPNNKSHWDPEIDPEWDLFAAMTTLAGQAIAAENPQILRVLGGLSPIDPAFIERLSAKGALEDNVVVALHGFPLDWNPRSEEHTSEIQSLMSSSYAVVCVEKKQETSEQRILTLLA